MYCFVTWQSQLQCMLFKFFVTDRHNVHNGEVEENWIQSFEKPLQVRTERFGMHFYFHSLLDFIKGTRSKGC